MEDRKKEEIRTRIVAITGIVLFLGLAGATMIWWDPVNPLPPSPSDPPAPQIPPDPSPWIQIDPVGTPDRGDQIAVTGTTRDPARNAVSVVVAARGAYGNRVWAGNTVKVTPGDSSLNRWSVVFDSSSFSLSENMVTACIENMSPPVCSSRQFGMDQPLETIATPAGCWQRIDPVTDHAAGEVFAISGTTDCRPGDRITIEIVRAGSGMREFLNASVEILLRSDDTPGWSVVIDSSSFEPGEKTVSACGTGICGFRTFNITKTGSGDHETA